MKGTRLDVASLAANARETWRPSNADRARVRQKLKAPLASSRLSAGPRVMWIAVAAVAVVGTAALLLMSDAKSEAAALQKRADTHASVAAPIAASAAAPHLQPVLSIAHAPPPSRTRRAAPLPPAPVPERSELELLRRADRALRDGDARSARAILQQHEEEFPTSLFADERAALSILAECAANAPDSGGLARRFIAEHPGSWLRQRLRSACEL